MADMDRSEQELAPGYYDKQFGSRVNSIRKAGMLPPTPSGGNSTGGGCLKGGGGFVVIAVILIRAFLHSGCRDSNPHYRTPYWNSPGIQSPNNQFNRKDWQPPNQFNNDKWQHNPPPPDQNLPLPRQGQELPRPGDFKADDDF